MREETVFVTIKIIQKWKSQWFIDSINSRYI